MKRLLRSFLLAVIMFAAGTALFAEASSIAGPEVRNFRVMIEGKSKSKPISFEALTAVGNGVERADSGQRISVQILPAEAGKYRVSYHVSNTFQSADGRSAEQMGIQSSFIVELGAKKLVFKETDSELYITVRDET